MSLIKKREGFKVVLPAEYKEAILNGQCPVCKKPKEQWKRRRDWRCCSNECTAEYGKHIFVGWEPLRRACIKRDMKCVKCGVTHTRVARDYDEDGGYYQTYEIIISSGAPYKSEDGHYTFVDRTLLDMSMYVVDHIHPIATGGSEWEISNLQTLCKACNKIKTRADMGDIAKLRLKSKLVDAGQSFLHDLEKQQTL